MQVSFEPFAAISLLSTAETPEMEYPFNLNALHLFENTHHLSYYLQCSKYCFYYKHFSEVW